MLKSRKVHLDVVLIIAGSVYHVTRFRLLQKSGGVRERARSCANCHRSAVLPNRQDSF